MRKASKKLKKAMKKHAPKRRIIRPGELKSPVVMGDHATISHSVFHGSTMLLVGDLPKAVLVLAEAAKEACEAAQTAAASASAASASVTAVAKLIEGVKSPSSAIEANPELSRLLRDAWGY